MGYSSSQEALLPEPSADVWTHISRRDGTADSTFWLLGRRCPYQRVKQYCSCTVLVLIKPSESELNNQVPLSNTSSS